MNRATIAATLTVALLAGWRVQPAGAQSVATRIDLTGVISEPARRKAMAARLRGRLARELRGEPTAKAKAKLDLVVRFSKGQLICEIYLDCAGAPRSHVGTTVLDTLTELPEAANRLSGSPKLWLARAERKMGKDNWLALRLLPTAPVPPWITTARQAGVWQIDPTQGTDAQGYCRLRKLAGDDPTQGDIFVPLGITKSTVTVTVADTNGTPLSAMHIYVQAGGYPDPHPAKLKQGKPTAVTDSSGKATFAWNEPSGPAYLLIVRDCVRLAKHVVAPTSSRFQDTVSVRARWYLNGKWVGLGEYIMIRAEEEAKIIKDWERREAILDKATKLAAEGRPSEALATLRALDPADPQRVAIEKGIADAKTAASVGGEMHLYRLAMRIKDYDEAIRHLTRAQAVASEDEKAPLVTEINKVRALAKEFKDKTRSALQELLTDLPGYSVAEIIAKIGDIKQATDMMCSTGHVPTLKRTGSELDKAYKLLTKAIDARLAQMKAGRLSTDDATYKEYARVRKMIRDLLRGVDGVINRAQPSTSPATAPAR